MATYTDDELVNPSYIGTKIVRARPMGKETFENKKKGTPEAEVSGKTPGYMVIYEDGYVSWSPEEVFERCYRRITDEEKKLAI